MRVGACPSVGLLVSRVARKIFLLLFFRCGAQRGVVPSSRGLRAVYSPATLRLRSCALRVRSVYALRALRVRSVYAPCKLLLTSGLVLFTSGFVRFASSASRATTCGLHQGHLRFTPGLPAWANRVYGPSRLSQGGACRFVLSRARPLLKRGVPAAHPIAAPGRRPPSAQAQVPRALLAFGRSGAHASRHADASTSTMARRRSVSVSLSLSLARVERRVVVARSRSSRVTRSSHVATRRQSWHRAECTERRERTRDERGQGGGGGGAVTATIRTHHESAVSYGVPAPPPQPWPRARLYLRRGGSQEGISRSNCTVHYTTCVYATGHISQSAATETSDGGHWRSPARALAGDTSISPNPPPAHAPSQRVYVNTVKLPHEPCGWVRGLVRLPAQAASSTATAAELAGA